MTPLSSHEDFDPVTLEILWSRLISTTDKSAAANTIAGEVSMTGKSSCQLKMAVRALARFNPAFRTRT